MALMAALSACLHHIDGFTNRTLRPVVATLLDKAYSPTQMSYDLRRLQGKRMIRRLPHAHTYVLTPEGTRVATFFTKTFRRIVDPLFAAVLFDAPPAVEPELRSALSTIDRAVDRFAQEAGIAA